jgi:dTDP-4-dehydrorhamnose 3,5-epimerase
MNVIRTEIPDLLIFEPRVFEDDRGWFMESFNQKTFDAAVGQHVEFVQDNHSLSKQGVLRGLHYQLPPNAQGKLVRVIQGIAWDVAVDIRKRSTTYGLWFGIELSAQNHKQVWIPPGFAHGFLTLSETVEIVYKTTSHYSLNCERCVRWDDPTLNIQWPTRGRPFILSQKDADGKFLQGAEVFD